MTIRNRLAGVFARYVPRRVRWFVIANAIDAACAQRRCYPGQLRWYDVPNSLDVKNPPVDLRQVTE